MAERQACGARGECWDSEPHGHQLWQLWTRPGWGWASVGDWYAVGDPYVSDVDMWELVDTLTCDGLVLAYSVTNEDNPLELARAPFGVNMQTAQRRADRATADG